MNCRYCDKKCYFQSYLDRHEKIHSEFPTEYECQHCSSELNTMFFRNKKGYISHLRHVHEDFSFTPKSKNYIDDCLLDGRFTQEDINNFFRKKV